MRSSSFQRFGGGLQNQVEEIIMLPLFFHSADWISPPGTMNIEHWAAILKSQLSILHFESPNLVI